MRVDTRAADVSIDGVAFRGGAAAPPFNVQAAEGALIRWHADSTTHSHGFMLCATQQPQRAQPPSPSPPPPLPAGPAPRPYPPGLAPPPRFSVVTSGNCERAIEDEGVCERAAQALGFSDSSALLEGGESASPCASLSPRSIGPAPDSHARLE